MSHVSTEVPCRGEDPEKSGESVVRRSTEEDWLIGDRRVAHREPSHGRIRWGWAPWRATPPLPGREKCPIIPTYRTGQYPWRRPDGLRPRLAATSQGQRMEGEDQRERAPRASPRHDPAQVESVARELADRRVAGPSRLLGSGRRHREVDRVRELVPALSGVGSQVRRVEPGGPPP